MPTLLELVGLMSTENEQKILHPSMEAVLRAEMQSQGNEKEFQDAAALDARKCMNAMRTVGAALNKVMLEPVNEGAAFQSLLDEAARVSRILLMKWGYNPEDRKNRWMVNVVEKALMPYLSTKTPLSDDIIARLSEALAERQTEYTDNDAWKNDQMIDIAVHKGVFILLNSQNEFNFGRKKTLDSDIQHLTELVTQAAQNAMEELCPELTPHPDRVTFYVILLEQMFDLMDASWKKNAIKAREALAGLSQDQLKIWSRSNPQGFELKPIEETFKQNAGRLLRLTLTARKQDKKSKK